MVEPIHTLLVGVDAGGTGCRAAIGTRSDGIIARAEGGRANAASDPDLAVRNIIATVSAAAEKAGIAATALGRAKAHLGIAGVLAPEDGARIAAAVPYGDVAVTDDRPTAVTGALGGRAGSLLSVGTGTIAARCDEIANIRFVGGWGFQVADQASGAWLGRQGLQQVLLCHDGIAEHTGLTRALFGRFGNDPNAIASFSMYAKPGDYAAFAPEIVSGASAGDPWGLSVMKSGADHLTQCLTALGFQAGDTLCLTGGLGPHYTSYLPQDLLSGRVRAHGNALDGAFRLAGSGLARSREAVS